MATDNCSSFANITFSYTETTAPTAIANTYYIYRDWVATDQCGNVSIPVRQTITVTDEVAPTLITSALPMDMTLACSDMIPDPAVLEYSDNCDGQIVISFAEVSTQSDDANDSEYYNYTITRTWFATDAAGNATPTTTQVITVQDLVAPVIVENTVPANSIINCSQAIPAPANVMFSDNCDEDLTITFEEVSTQGSDANLSTYYNYTITRTWFATDATGLVSPTVTEVITVQDITVPTVVENTIPANVTLNCQDAIPAPAAVLFTDGCDADLTINYTEVSTQGSTPNTFAYYNYTITRTWSATDASGNTSAVITQVITVQDITAPVVVATSLPADVTITCYDVIPPVANVMYEDNCSTPSITYNQTSTFVSNPENILYYNYIITRTWFATDATGNVSPTSTQVITIVDTDAPTVVLASVPADATVSCSDIPDAPTVLFTDACDATPVVTFNEVSTQVMNPALATYYNYTITRTWFATDASNHVSPTVTQVITVQDIMAPVVVEASVPENITFNCQDVIPVAPTVQFTDNCDLNPTVVLSTTNSWFKSCCCFLL
jgi:large repetitive protein